MLGRRSTRLRAFPPRYLDISGARRAARRGAAAVEFALVSPLLFALVLGIFEFSRAFMVGEVLNNAARVGARYGSITGATNSTVNSAIAASLSGITNTTTTIKVNGSAADVSTARRNDVISIQVSVPYSSVSWLPVSTYLTGATLSGTATLYHE